MKRKLPTLLGLAAIAIALVIWQCRGGDRPSSTTGRTGSAAGSSALSSTKTAARPRPDPRTLAKASITGTVTLDATKAPIAGIRVCAAGWSKNLADDLLREPACATTDAAGAYSIEPLLPARYTVTASGRGYRPAVHHVGGDRKRRELSVAAGERKTGIDIALRSGGAEVTGTVADVSGGPIAKARVWSGDHGEPMVLTETDDAGAFALWVDKDDVRIHAAADGYTDEEESVDAPGKVEILLTPESTIAGIVIDAATSQPVEGARVQIGEWSGEAVVFSDAAGAFRARRLSPGRHVVIARTEHGYGRTEGSTLAGLGQEVEGVVVKLFPAVRVEAKIIISTTKQACTEGADAYLRDTVRNRWVRLNAEPDGALWADGVLPGSYTPEIQCDGYQARDKYTPIPIADQDVLGLVWEVDPGATVRGQVRTKSGEPVEDANVWARTVGGAPRARGGWGGASSDRDGRYELVGLRPGTYRIEASSDQGLAPKDGFRVEVAAGATVEQDLVLEDGGSIKGVVVDATGAPVGGIDVHARLTAGGGRGWGDKKSDDAGAFVLDGLRPGEYRVTAQRGWSTTLRKPGTTDDAKQGEKVTVRANQAATVRLVVEALAGTIKGTVVDGTGAPVGDAFVSAARESDAAGAKNSSVGDTRWSWDEKPVLTSTDGAFTISKLPPGMYTIRAYRRGGGEAVAEHVAIGGTAKLQIKPTGSIAGVARRAGTTLEEIDVAIQDKATGFHRSETFYMTGGAFLVRDLPKGSFEITVESAGARKLVDVPLAEGEARTGVAIELEALRTLTGKVVEHGSGKPVAGIRMFAVPVTGGGGYSWSASDDERNITDEAGAFTIENAPTGKIMVRGMPKDWRESDYGVLALIRTPEGTDLGTLPILKKRVKPGEAVGELGLNFAEQPPGTPEDERQYKVSWIDPAGAAAKTELKVGDIVTSVDGMEITGASSSQAWVLMRAPPGTRLALGLARGVTVTVTLAVP